MLHVVLRDGRVLKYNDADQAIQQQDHFYISGGKYWYARIPLDVVERIDGGKPCQILKESRDKKKMKKY